MRKVLSIILSFILFQFIIGTANASDVVTQDGSGTFYIWDIEGDGSVDDLCIARDNVCDDSIVDDGYDNFGFFYRDGAEVDGSISPGESSSGSYSWNDESPEDLTVVATTEIFGNRILRTLTTSSSLRLGITGDLGSDSNTRWIEVNGYIFSYQRRLIDGIELGPRNDPIWLWDTNGTIKDDDDTPLTTGEDDVGVFLTGTSLSLLQRAYAFENNALLTTAEFFDIFSRWVAENPERMDVFTVSWSPQAQIGNVRKSRNLSFNQSMFGSDVLSDPTGELRALIDLINRLYSN